MITIYSSDSMGVRGNCLYPYRHEVTDTAGLREAVRHDYVCAEYKNSYRSGDNFITSNCLGMDCDNDHTDHEHEWITPDDVRRNFPDVPLAIHFSRHHMKPKDQKSSRPRFHCLFAIEPTTDVKAYANMKARLNALFPYFDAQALDGARFFFGTDNPEVDFFPGTITLDECLERYYPEEDSFANLPDGIPQGRAVIQEGSRNRTMSVFAGKILKRYGDSDQTHDLFLQEAAKCDPPLPDEELATIWRSARSFYQRIRRQPDYVPPEKYNADTPDDFAFRPADDTDVGEARMLADVFYERLRYSRATDYLCYDGVSWNEDIPGAHRVVHELTDLQLAEAEEAMTAAWKVLLDNGSAEMIETLSPKKALAAMSEDQQKAFAWYNVTKRYYQLAMSYRASKNIRYVLNEAPALLLISPQELDADPFALNTPAGTLDLRRGLTSMRDHCPEDFVTKVTAVAPGDEGTELWQDALNTIFCKNPELIDYVQLIAGMALVGRVFSETLIIAYGDGRNGKSTFWNVLARVLGSYGGKISADALTVGCKRNVKPEMAEAKGKRMLIASELEEGMRLNTSIVKQLCSTDPIEAEKKYKDPFHFEPSHTLILYTNHLPRVGAIDDGTWRRLIVIPFAAKIDGKRDIKNYADYLFTNAGGAILKWMIEGAVRVIDAEFKIDLPVCVQEAIKAYRGENDWLGHFLTDRCDVGKELTEQSGTLYTAYRQYCAECGEYTRSTTDFYTALENEGFVRQRTRKGSVIRGLTLRNDDFLE